MDAFASCIPHEVDREAGVDGAIDGAVPWWNAKRVESRVMNVCVPAGASGEEAQHKRDEDSHIRSGNHDWERQWHNDILHDPQVDIRFDPRSVGTTHSPFVVDCVEASAVRIMSVDKNEHAICTKLTDHPDWERWRTSLRAGEFWSFVGEDWMFGA